MKIYDNAQAIAWAESQPNLASALAWVKTTVWWSEQKGNLKVAADCLLSDALDGEPNKASSWEQAEAWSQLLLDAAKAGGYREETSAETEVRLAKEAAHQAQQAAWKAEREAAAKQPKPAPASAYGERGQMPQACEHDSQALARWSAEESYRCGDSWTDDGF